MTTKTFCDRCENEMQPVRRPCTAPIERDNGAMLQEMVVYLNDKLNAKDICLYCMIDAFKKLDDRPSRAGVAPFAVVPVEPTIDMIVAGRAHVPSNGRDDIQDAAVKVYRAMLAAAEKS